MKNGSPFTISQLCPNERNALGLFLQKSWAETYVTELGDQITAKMIDTLSSEDIGGLVPNNDELVYLATQNNQIRGCAISATRHGITYLWGFYVLAKYQRQGIGRSLLRQIVSVCDSANTVQLNVLKSSINAVKFYQAQGFEINSEEVFEISPGHMTPSITMIAPASKLI